MRIGIISSMMASKRVYRASDSSRASVEEMGVDHRRFHVTVA
jgi:hypothetical protein